MTRWHANSIYCRKLIRLFNKKKYILWLRFDIVNIELSVRHCQFWKSTVHVTYRVLVLAMNIETQRVFARKSYSSMWLILLEKQILCRFRTKNKFSNEKGLIVTLLFSVEKAAQWALVDSLIWLVLSFKYIFTGSKN